MPMPIKVWSHLFLLLSFFYKIYCRIIFCVDIRVHKEIRESCIICAVSEGYISAAPLVQGLSGIRKKLYVS